MLVSILRNRNKENRQANHNHSPAVERRKVWYKEKRLEAKQTGCASKVPHVVNEAFNQLRVLVGLLPGCRTTLLDQRLGIDLNLEFGFYLLSLSFLHVMLAR
jgi:hypothetical protein